MWSALKEKERETTHRWRKSSFWIPLHSITLVLHHWVNQIKAPWQFKLVDSLLPLKVLFHKWPLSGSVYQVRLWSWAVHPRTPSGVIVALQHEHNWKQTVMETASLLCGWRLRPDKSPLILAANLSGPEESSPLESTYVTLWPKILYAYGHLTVKYVTL